MKIIENDSITNDDKLKFLMDNDGGLSKLECMDLVTKIEPQIFDLQTNGEQKFNDDMLSTLLVRFLEEKELCKHRTLKHGFKLIKKI